MQRFIEVLTLRISRPWYVAVLFVSLVAWICAHIYAAIVPVARINADPTWISVFLEFVAVLTTALILTGQHKEQDFSDEREELALELLLLIDRKLSASTSARPIDVAHAKETLDAAHEEQFAAER
jgi:hypothetical protein